METYQFVLTAVSTVGFPIVAYGAMFLYMMKQTSAHKEEIATLQKTLQENTLAITELKDWIKSGCKAA